MVGVALPTTTNPINYLRVVYRVRYICRRRCKLKCVLSPLVKKFGLICSRCPPIPMWALTVVRVGHSISYIRLHCIVALVGLLVVTSSLSLSPLIATVVSIPFIVRLASPVSLVKQRSSVVGLLLPKQFPSLLYPEGVPLVRLSPVACPGPPPPLGAVPLRLGRSVIGKFYICRCICSRLLHIIWVHIGIVNVSISSTSKFSRTHIITKCHLLRLLGILNILLAKGRRLRSTLLTAALLTVPLLCRGKGGSRLILPILKYCKKPPAALHNRGCLGKLTCFPLLTRFPRRRFRTIVS